MANPRTAPEALVGVLAASALLVGCTSSTAPEPTPHVLHATPSMAAGPALNLPAAPAPAAPACGDPAAIIASMSTRDKLAQRLMVGVTGAADARAVVDAHHVGGIMVGSWTDLSMLSDNSLADIAATAAPLPPAVSVDEEGGRVSRLAGLIGAQPSPRRLAATSSPEQVYQIALERGRKMRGLGITIDFAPVVDVTDAPDGTVIGDRSFGADPTAVVDYAGAYARGLRDAGVLPVLKHFPGHGSGSGDTHAGSVVTPPLGDLVARDLVPYRTLTTQGPVGVMVGHMEVPGLTGSEPASLSPPAYALLRSGDYGGPPFGGPVFTDDLSGMQAITDRLGVADAVLRSLQAGADVALWLSTAEVPAVLDRLEQAVAAGELTMPRIDEAVTRVIAMKGPSPRCGG
ncbi:glycoside hydrolase family 3 protein [Mycolicibacterium austroafricanum]|uniref:beta-N-acetylhexosaminidase n=2 Tax=Mycolicibacterium austroafricanum TaxID=39687 RepID=A0ABT8H785_MYCAO|nr:glycoside hydrolase family 3 N-terminal domain-containing protein [Mycolicibacterium austroafricanum]MDN4516623.1 glycoside hydrolase family 3 N-terminal domain-containing protein [Mycolicibacterium austroafricanum]QRZ05007.1 glycoside hydrolase family 3 protein [Mycolicibacterium austroafricanum]QZT68746.1 glycoside hydrolase family 3 protein [Mycolicibacterium austroafricanum]